MNKNQEYLKQLVAIHNNLYVALACVSLLQDENVVSSLSENQVTISGTDVIKFDFIAEHLNDKDNLAEAAQSLVMNTLKSTVKDCYEVVLAYAHEVDKLQVLKEKSWYQFARMCRNNLSHTQTFEFRSHDKTLLPVTWKGITIDITQQGQPISSKFGLLEVIDLVREMKLFVAEK
ncbi:hypothetical protein [Photobacterium phosphoreum]|uniref:hypothetical protein n=1 Tax=Photobacterium phosphoreum TaxID=659 RepID=UPI0011B1E2E7|nr:hypothetical protein [Photobacterium phosphoreum]